MLYKQYTDVPKVSPINFFLFVAIAGNVFILQGYKFGNLNAYNIGKSQGSFLLKLVTLK